MFLNVLIFRDHGIDFHIYLLLTNIINFVNYNRYNKIIISGTWRCGKNLKNLIENIYEAIGETPLLHLRRITDQYGVSGKIYAKLEYLNPGYSKKDRPALQMIEEAEKSGELKPGQTVVELTSGNTGTGLSLLCRAKGHPFIAVMSEGNSLERARMMRALGAEVILVPQCEGSVKGQVSGKRSGAGGGADERALAGTGRFRADQFRLDSSYEPIF